MGTLGSLPPIPYLLGLMTRLPPIIAFCFICLIALPTNAESPLLLLEDPDAWFRVDGSEESFTFNDGAVEIGWADNNPSVLLSKKIFENFEASFEFNTSKWCESGFFISAPSNGATRAGIEVELNNQVSEPPSVLDGGALFREVPPLVPAMNPYETSNTCWVKMDWPRLMVKINDKVVQNIDLSEHPRLKYALRRGSIGFQSSAGTIHIRNFSISPLPDSENGIVAIPDQGLDGWQVVNSRNSWENRDGVIHAEDGNGYLLFNKVCQDFDFHCLYRTSPNSNGGVFFRWVPGKSDDDYDRGNEIQIWDNRDTITPSGSVYHFDRGNEFAFEPREWNLLQIFVRGSHAKTFINGVPSAETDSLEKVRPGHIVLQMHRTHAWVEWKEMILVPRD